MRSLRAILLGGCLLLIGGLLPASADSFDICQDLGLCMNRPPVSSTTSSTDSLWNSALGNEYPDLNTALNDYAELWHEHLVWVGKVDSALTDTDKDYLVVTASAPGATPSLPPDESTWTSFIVHNGKVRILAFGIGNSTGPFPSYPEANH